MHSFIDLSYFYFLLLFFSHSQNKNDTCSSQDNKKKIDCRTVYLRCRALFSIRLRNPAHCLWVNLVYDYGQYRTFLLELSIWLNKTVYECHTLPFTSYEIMDGRSLGIFSRVQKLFFWSWIVNTVTVSSWKDFTIKILMFYIILSVE